MKKAFPLLPLLLAGLFWLVLASPALAAPVSQGVVYQTPTPMPDGRILYKVQSNDTCLSISLLTGVPLDTLRKNNNLNGDCVIQVGQELLLGRVESTATPTPGPSPTPTPLLPTPTPFNGNGQVCVFLYNDVNGDAIQQETETAISGGAVSLTDRTGKVSMTQETSAGDQPVCFDEVPEGDYNISVAVPDGYNPTTSMNYALKVEAGDQSTLDFGAQLNSQAAPVTPSEGGRSPVLGILGAVLLLSGIGLGVYVRLGRKTG
ncbi:MAG: LysM peptidoglycan-binding domain-containing protein [Chloroflexi bacterium]|nr:LysM peptidoglycan-binding domain-containing protein [Chloroflexota bacterium]